MRLGDLDDLGDLLAAATDLVAEAAAGGLISWSDAATVLRPFERLCFDESDRVLCVDEMQARVAAWVHAKEQRPPSPSVPRTGTERKAGTGHRRRLLMGGKVDLEYVLGEEGHGRS